MQNRYCGGHDNDFPDSLEQELKQLAVFLASLLLFAGLLPALSPVRASTTTVQFVLPTWVAEHANDPNLRVLDVRVNPFDYFTAHIQSG